MSRLPHSLEKSLSAGKIHPVSLIEICLCLTGDDCGKVIDNFWAIRNERFRDTRVGDIGRKRTDLERSASWRSRFYSIGHRQPDYRSASDDPALYKRLAKFAADHSGCAGHQDFHTSFNELNDA
jgi:hypothetical protein